MIHRSRYDRTNQVPRPKGGYALSNPVFISRLENETTMFEGAHVALVTPFERGADQIHHQNLHELIEFQIEAGIDGIVVSGTTGESPALSGDEKRELIDSTVDAVGDRVQLIAGTGTSSTRETLELTRYAHDAGCDGALIVCPPYNKPEPEGMYAHYATVAKETDCPIIMYDNPGRSGVGIPARTVIELAEFDQIRAIKEASGDLTHAMKIREETDVELLSGSDALTYPLLALGGRGIISVVANVRPERTASMVHHYLNGNPEQSRALHESLYPLMDTLMDVTNPIPVKTALAMTNRIHGELRKPLVPPDDPFKKRLEDVLQQTAPGR